MILSTEKRSDAYLELNSCGRQFLADRDYKMIRENGRVDYHILYIEKGTCTIELAGEERTVPAGNIILFKPYEKQVYSFKADDDSISCYIHFSGTECETILKKFGLMDSPVTHVGANNTLERIFSEMENTYLLKPPYYTETCAALLLHFLAAAGRQKQYEMQELNIRSRKNIEMVCKHMHTHYDKQFSISFYAEMCHLSVSRFAHIFKEHTGLTPKAYMLNIKISVAKNLLTSTDLPITDIATIIGIEDANYFSRMVRKHTGHSPKHFRT